MRKQIEPGKTQNNTLFPHYLERGTGFIVREQ